ncbi:MAG: hypothetical protein HQK96_20040, partial [Nitrospirae bacterium]|nr:hypothetical protein [Nitrospirota bacterium]
MDYSKATEFEDFNTILKGIICYLKEQCGKTTLDANQEAIISEVVNYVDVQARLK